MKETKYKVETTSVFKKELKLAKKRGYNINDLQTVVEMLADGITLPEKYCDHYLVGQYKGYRECHIYPDWLLVYKVQDDVLVLTLSRTGTHSDLFR